MNKRAWHFLFGLLCLVLLPQGALSGAPAASWRKHIVVGRYAEAEASIRRMLRENTGENWERLQLNCALAAALRLQGKAAEGLTVLQALEPPNSNAPAVRLEMGNCLLASKQGAEAARVWASSRHAADVPLRCRVNAAAGRLAFDDQQWELCVAVLEQTLADAGTLSLAAFASDPELKAAVEDARQVLAKAREAWLRARYGEDYFQYRKGREAQARGDWQEAVQRYRRVRGTPVLTDAAGCYTTECLAREALGADRATAPATVAQKRLAKVALAEYAKFLAGSEDKLYREEAALGFALFQLRTLPPQPEAKQVQTLRQALERLDRTLDRLAANLAAERGNSREALKAIRRVMDDFPPPAEFAMPNQTGGLVRQHPGPETVHNRLTSPWYLGYLKLQTTLLRAYVAALAGDPVGGQRVVTTAFLGDDASAARLRKLARDEAPERLLAELGHGSFLVPPEAWKRIKGEQAATVRLGLALFCGGEWEWARGVLNDVTAPVAGNADADSATDAAARLGLGACLFNMGEIKEAQSQWGTVATTFSGKLEGLFADLLLANLQAGEPGKFQEVSGLYQKIAASEACPSLKPRALFCLALAAANHGRTSEAKTALTQLLRESRNSFWAKSAASLSTALPVISSEPGFSRKPDIDKPGKAMALATPGKGGGVPADAQDEMASPPATALPNGVLPVRRHLVLPGGGNLGHDYVGVTAANLLWYEVSWSPRSSCVKVPQFGLRLGEMEPQLATTTARRMVFLRAPILYADVGDSAVTRGR